MYYQNYLKWKNCVKDANLLVEILDMDKDQIYNSFFRYIEFGTGGLRGIMGAGTNCINIYTIKKASQGIANFMKKKRLKSIAISYDNRNNSELFSAIAAQVFATNNIKVFLTKELMPTPFLSFAVRSIKTDLGVMITASHNPANYNGYKVYDNSGCQCTDKMAALLGKFIQKVNEFEVNPFDFDVLLEANKIEYIPELAEEKYIKNVLAQQINGAMPLRVAFSPLHGTGYRLVPQVLQNAGFSEVDIVPEQAKPDGDFPTCKYPNPEKQEAMELGLKYAKENNSDILLVTDPDCDRVGVAVKHKNTYFRLTGNEIGALLTDYIFSEKKKQGKLPANPIVIKTIVSSELGKLVAERFGAKVINVLTGFKYIGEQINFLEKEGRTKDFVLGYEESYGYLIGGYVRDKDAAVASLLIAEMAATLLKRGQTLVDRLNELHKEYGFFEHKLYAFNFEGAQGYKKMQNIMIRIRKNIPKSISSEKLASSIDYLEKTELSLPKSNVLELNYQKGTKIIIRPSGTEPLIKVYVVASQNAMQNDAIFKDTKKYIDKIISDA